MIFYGSNFGFAFKGSHPGGAGAERDWEGMFADKITQENTI